MILWRTVKGAMQGYMHLFESYLTVKRPEGHTTREHYLRQLNSWLSNRNLY